MAAAMAIGYVAGIGLHDLQLWLEGAAPEWIAGGGTKVNAYRGTTDIGRLGELKMSDAIALRVRPEFELKPPLLLHQASYNDYVGVNWIARGGTFSKLPPEAGGRSWRLGAGANSLVLVVDEQARHGDPVLALPLGAVAILDVDARALKRNPLGAVQIEASAGFIAYRVSFDPGIAERHSPGAAELTIPPAERATIERIAREWGLAGLSAQNAVDAIRARLFADFTYSTFQKAAAGSATPLADFLLRTRSGHCEHFASATTLLLRAVGVPARYASGYSIQEWSDLEGAWIARERHSHAWTRAFVDGKWIDVDSTPPIWLELENRERPAWAKLADAWSWVRYRIERWFEATGAAERSLALGLPIGLLLLGLAWRALRALRAAALRPAPAATPVPATDASGSEFTLVERHLAALGAPREPAETVREWMARIAARIPGDAAELARLAALHYRLRFDPAGLARGEREDLARGAARWISSTPTG